METTLVSNGCKAWNRMHTTSQLGEALNDTKLGNMQNTYRARRVVVEDLCLSEFGFNYI